MLSRKVVTVVWSVAEVKIDAVGALAMEKGEARSRKWEDYGKE
jgi:hypothetical protein